MLLPKAGRKLPMCDVASELKKAREGAAALVDREEYRCRSRMTAYYNIASMIGRSESWLRKFIAGREEVGLDFEVGLTIRAMYERICFRIDQNTEAINRRAATIEEATDALAALDLEKSAGEAPPVPSDEGAAPGIPQDGED